MALKKILIFSLSYFPVVGGAEVAVKEITTRISTNDIEWDMVTMRFSKSHPKFEKIGNINVYRVGNNASYLNKILFVPRATLFALRRKYDFYWCIMTYMLFPAVLAGRAPYVLTLQDGDPFEHVFNRWFTLPFRPLLHYGIKHAAKIQAISTFLAKWAKRDDVLVIPNGVDMAKFQITNDKLQKDRITLITTSRLVEKNAVGDIIEAVKFMPENIELQILGSGPLEESLKLKTKNLKLENMVKFLGNVGQEEIPRYLHQADIFIRPSLSEGQGISFIEAMAAGLPVIATPVGGIPDFLKDKETGLFCEVSNPQSIAEQVERLIKDESLRNKIIASAKKMVEEKYDWDLIARDMKKRVFEPIL
ncbi:MAG: glycosyltransferase family 4 protein [Candidatus Zambryskibacteria bacterium]|nr:glycosyltransferase family 4 protein [Candidatus Zambryskibacteria bacterium]